MSDCICGWAGYHQEKHGRSVGETRSWRVPNENCPVHAEEDAPKQSRLWNFILRHTLFSKEN